MSKTPRQYVFDAMELMRPSLHPYVTGAAKAGLGSDWQRAVLSSFRHWRPDANGKYSLDTQKLLQIMDRFWAECFREKLDRSHRSIVNELIDVRNRLAHDGPFSEDDAERSLDSMRRLLSSIGANEAADHVAKRRDEILRGRYSTGAKLVSPSLVPASAVLDQQAGERGSKYDLLSAYLSGPGPSSRRMTFTEIEDVLGFKLPPSAREHPAWWANTRSHRHAHAWLSVGWGTSDLDQAGETVTFRHTGSA